MSDTKPLSAFWRYAEAADFLGITPGTLRRKVMYHAVPFARPFGKKGRVLFDPADLEAFVEASKVPALTE
jgi:excisionase family DNA binding protein